MSIHTLRHQLRKYYTLDNTVLTLAIVIALGWIWGTMDTLQNNFRLQAQVNILRQQVQQDSLEAQNLELENQYYASPEYLELEARKRLGKAAPGESLLILPPNTIKDATTDGKKQVPANTSVSNFQAWLDFFFANKRS